MSRNTAGSQIPGTGTSRLGSRPLLRAGLWLSSMFVGINLLLPQLAGLEATGQALARASWWLPPTIVLLACASWLCQGELQRTLLRAGGVPVRRALIQRTALVGTALGKSLPGGATTGLAIVIHMLRGHGHRTAAVTAALAASGAVSSATLALLLPIAAVVALAGGDAGPVALGAAGVAIAIVVAVAVVPLALQQPARAGALVESFVRRAAVGPFRRSVDAAAIGELVRVGIASAKTLLANRRALRAAFGWAAANWLLDVGVLAVIALTIGAGTPLTALPLAYVIASLLAAVPLTPGGVGLVEPAMIGALIAAGAEVGDATATVLGWRLVSHWLAILGGLVLLPTVAPPPWRSSPGPPAPRRRRPSARASR